MKNKFAIAIHGGAGTILKKNIPAALEKQYLAKLSESLKAGYNVLENKGTAVDAITAAIKVMEDSPLFNAGKGSVFTADGKIEMDAAIMDGETLKAGAVAGVMRIKNPIIAALSVMQRSQHVLLMGKGAEKFAKASGCDIEKESYFFDQKRWEQFQKIKQSEKVELDHGSGNKPPAKLTLDPSPSEKEKGRGQIEKQFRRRLNDKKFGTVGAVALDKFGNIAAGTSTGGMTNKKYGRVGDSPIIGAGTYANNKTCAVSCTGHGEYFIRSVVAYDISAFMEYKGKTLKQAANEVVMKKLKAIGGEGGLIAIDAKGNIVLPFNTAGMYRGFMKGHGEIKIDIYKKKFKQPF